MHSWFDLSGLFYSLSYWILPLSYIAALDLSLSCLLYISDGKAAALKIDWPMNFPLPSIASLNLVGIYIYIYISLLKVPTMLCLYSDKDNALNLSCF